MIIEYYKELELELLKKLIEHFKFNNEFINSDYWYIEKLKEFKIYTDDIVKIIAKATNKTPHLVAQELNKLGFETIDTTQRLLGEDYREIDFINRPVFKALINKSIKSLDNSLIQLKDNMISSCKELYLQTLERVYIGVSEGTKSYDQAIMETINDLSKKGIKCLTYEYEDENGNKHFRNYDISGVVRREVATATNQLSNDLNYQMCIETNCEYIKLSEHLFCREEHFDWQGTIIKFEDLQKITDYGSITGLGGINCKHYFEPYFDNPNNDTKTLKKEDCIEKYNQSQVLRKLERTERRYLRKKELLKDAGYVYNGEGINELKLCDTKIDLIRNEIIRYTKENNLQRDFSRETI